MIIRQSSHWVFGFTAIILFFSRSLSAGLLVAPTRIVLSEDQRVATVTLRHIGTREGRYRLSLIFNRMKPDGSMEEVTNPTAEERPAMKLVRFAPSVAVLQPNVEQIARIMLIPKKDIPDGEYRAHLLFDPTEDTERDVVGGTKKNDGKSIGMRLEANMSVAVPVFVRYGEVSVQPEMSNFKLSSAKGGAPAISFDLASRGNGFLRGDLEVFFNPKGQDPILVGLVRGLPSYLSFRKFSTPLSIPKGVVLRNGALRAELREPEQGGVKGKLLHTAQILIP